MHSTFKAPSAHTADANFREEKTASPQSQDEAKTPGPQLESNLSSPLQAQTYKRVTAQGCLKNSVFNIEFDQHEEKNIDYFALLGIPREEALKKLMDAGCKEDVIHEVMDEMDKRNVLRQVSAEIMESLLIIDAQDKEAKNIGSDSEYVTTYARSEKAKNLIKAYRLAEEAFSKTVGEFQTPHQSDNNHKLLPGEILFKLFKLLQTEPNGENRAKYNEFQNAKSKVVKARKALRAYCEDRKVFTAFIQFVIDNKDYPISPKSGTSFSLLDSIIYHATDVELIIWQATELPESVSFAHIQPIYYVTKDHSALKNAESAVHVIVRPSLGLGSSENQSHFSRLKTSSLFAVSAKLIPSNEFLHDTDQDHRCVIKSQNNYVIGEWVDNYFYEAVHAIDATRMKKNQEDWFEVLLGPDMYSYLQEFRDTPEEMAINRLKHYSISGLWETALNQTYRFKQVFFQEQVWNKYEEHLARMKELYMQSLVLQEIGAYIGNALVHAINELEKTRYLLKKIDDYKSLSENESKEAVIITLPNSEQGSYAEIKEKYIKAVSELSRAVDEAFEAKLKESSYSFLEAIEDLDKMEEKNYQALKAGDIKDIARTREMFQEKINSHKTAKKRELTEYKKIIYEIQKCVVDKLELDEVRRVYREALKYHEVEIVSNVDRPSSNKPQAEVKISKEYQKKVKFFLPIMQHYIDIANIDSENLILSEDQKTIFIDFSKELDQVLSYYIHESTEGKDFLNIVERLCKNLNLIGQRSIPYRNALKMELFNCLNQERDDIIIKSEFIHCGFPENKSPLAGNLSLLVNKIKKLTLDRWLLAEHISIQVQDFGDRVGQHLIHSINYYTQKSQAALDALDKVEHKPIITDLIQLKIGYCRHSDIFDPDNGFTLLHYAMFSWHAVRVAKKRNPNAKVDEEAANRLFKIIELLYMRGSSGIVLGKDQNKYSPFSLIDFDGVFSGYANLPADQIWQIIAWQFKRTMPICEYSHKIRNSLKNYSQDNHSRLSGLFSKYLLDKDILFERLQACKRLIKKLDAVERTLSVEELDRDISMIIKTPDWSCGFTKTSTLRTGLYKIFVEKNRRELLTFSSPPAPVPAHRNSDSNNAQDISQLRRGNRYSYYYHNPISRVLPPGQRLSTDSADAGDIELTQRVRSN